MDIHNLLKDFKENKAVQFGEFTLKSGLISPIYVDLRVLNSTPTIRRKIADSLRDEIDKASIEFDYLLGVPYGAIRLTALVSDALGKPEMSIRKEAKTYGKEQVIETPYEAGKRVLIIEDVVTSGSSIIETVDKVRKAGLTCEHAFCVVDRQQGGVQKLETKKIRLQSLVQMDDILDFYANEINKEKIMDQLESTTKIMATATNGTAVNWSIATREALFPEWSFNKRLAKIMLDKCSNLCLAVDYRQKEKIFEILEKVKESICVLKLHHNIVEDRDPEFFKCLRAKADKYQFMLFEDSKYADIANTIRMQIMDGQSNVAQWADVVTAYANPGEKSIRAAFEEITRAPEYKLSGILLIAELSVEGAINCTLERVVEVGTAVGPELVSGFICQKRCHNNPNFLYWTPGVNLTATEDGKGQRWRGVEQAIVDDGCDLIIVGRGITNADDPGAEARRYQKAGWAALAKR